jgi:hypothetical protein
MVFRFSGKIRLKLTFLARLAGRVLPSARWFADQFLKQFLAFILSQKGLPF